MSARLVYIKNAYTSWGLAFLNLTQLVRLQLIPMPSSIESKMPLVDHC